MKTDDARNVIPVMLVIAVLAVGRVPSSREGVLRETPNSGI